MPSRALLVEDLVVATTWTKYVRVESSRVRPCRVKCITPETENIVGALLQTHTDTHTHTTIIQYLCECVCVHVVNKYV